MIYQSEKGNFKVAGWNISKDGKLYIEKMSGASVMITDNAERARLIHDLLCEISAQEEAMFMNLEEAMYSNFYTDTRNVHNDEGDVVEEDVFINLLPDHLKESSIRRQKQSAELKQKLEKATPKIVPNPIIDKE